MEGARSEEFGWGLAGCVPSGGLTAAHGALPSAENVTCHRDGMQVEFSSELSNYSWHVDVVGMYCCALPCLLSLPAAGLTLPVPPRCEW